MSIEQKATTSYLSIRNVAFLIFIGIAIFIGFVYGKDRIWPEKKEDATKQHDAIQYPLSIEQQKISSLRSYEKSKKAFLTSVKDLEKRAALAKKFALYHSNLERAWKVSRIDTPLIQEEHYPFLCSNDASTEELFRQFYYFIHSSPKEITQQKALLEKGGHLSYLTFSDGRNLRDMHLDQTLITLENSVEGKGEEEDNMYLPIINTIIFHGARLFFSGEIVEQVMMLVRSFSSQNHINPFIWLAAFKPLAQAAAFLPIINFAFELKRFTLLITGGLRLLKCAWDSLLKPWGSHAMNQFRNHITQHTGILANILNGAWMKEFIACLSALQFFAHLYPGAQPFTFVLSFIFTLFFGGAQLYNNWYPNAKSKQSSFLFSSLSFTMKEGFSFAIKEGILSFVVLSYYYLTTCTSLWSIGYQVYKTYKELNHSFKPNPKRDALVADLSYLKQAFDLIKKEIDRLEKENLLPGDCLAIKAFLSSEQEGSKHIVKLLNEAVVLDQYNKEQLKKVETNWIEAMVHSIEYNMHNYGFLSSVYDIIKKDKKGKHSKAYENFKEAIFELLLLIRNIDLAHKRQGKQISCIEQANRPRFSLPDPDKMEHLNIRNPIILGNTPLPDILEGPRKERHAYLRRVMRLWLNHLDTGVLSYLGKSTYSVPDQFFLIDSTEDPEKFEVELKQAIHAIEQNPTSKILLVIEDPALLAPQAARTALIRDVCDKVKSHGHVTTLISIDDARAFELYDQKENKKTANYYHIASEIDSQNGVTYEEKIRNGLSPYRPELYRIKRGFPNLDKHIPKEVNRDKDVEGDKNSLIALSVFLGCLLLLGIAFHLVRSKEDNDTEV